MVGLDELAIEELFLAPSDPVVIELNRLQNQLKEKDRELGVAHGEIKALRLTEVLKDKAVEELSSELKKFDEKLRAHENLLEQKNLEIKKLRNEKKEALAAQFAAEATLRRVHSNQKDEDSVPIEAVIAPLEADIKMYKNEITALLEDNKALERLTKSKELALLEAEKILRSALERALIVEEVQNQNLELKRQIEICQEENRTLDRTNRQKVIEVEKLSQTIQELEESILAGGVAANAIRDYMRQISELNEEKRLLERELARAQVSANRVAAVVANEWKDGNDKVMPVKQWLEERRFLQAEIQKLRDKLIMSERTAKAEAQLKDKLRLRLKTMEEGLKHVSSLSITSNPSCGSKEAEKTNHVLGFLNNAGLRKRSTSQPRASLATNKSSQAQQPIMGTETALAAGKLKRSSSLKMKNGAVENMRRKSLWASKSKVADSAGKENTEVKANSDLNVDKYIDIEIAVPEEVKTKGSNSTETQNKSTDGTSEDVVSGFLYDRLQKEVINLRKRCEDKDGTLNAKDDEIKVLMRRVDALTKAMEIESKKLKREAAAREKELLTVNLEDSKQQSKHSNFSKRTSKTL
ncbi:Microtubule-associated protein 70 [Macleaya cordata]|uniref:Microtubule-associated protein 70 n=1 Tax=Macleaya cordata TaxID=56857 RepID=A0A200RBU6_MACCD|nr:Microtubule-associated protein 70 [Macleaya cordata]